MSDIKVRVRRFVEDNFLMSDSAARIEDGHSFLEHHVLDSTGFLELIAFLEDNFGVEIEDDEMVPENLDSLDNIEAFMGRKASA